MNAGPQAFISLSAFLVSEGQKIFDSFETSLNIADQEAIDLTIPKAIEKGMGMIAKRPVANVAWKFETISHTDYAYPYWQRLGELNYDFLTDVREGGRHALKFTLSTPGVATAIVGTAKPDRWEENASMLADGSTLSRELYNAIQNRWKKVAGEDWSGQV